MTRFIRNTRGQVAIFIALLFQVLFLFFAMIVNVGLLVHHKINLQNSVDLAAYYGASKQAEVLNAIAHVNYQIRQSWKLLVWRQKVLGTAGVDPTDATFPYRKLASGGPGVLSDNFPPPIGIDIFKLPTFCVAYAPHEIRGGTGANTENFCKYMYRSVTTPLPTASILYIPGFFNFGNTVAAAITSAATQAFQRCNQIGPLNYMVGGSFIAAHYRDSEERAYLMNNLASGLSFQEDNFYELSGDLVKTGLEKTLKKNLTDANGSTVEYEVYNSMASASCKQPMNIEGSNPPSWLVPIYTYPVWRYLDCDNNGDVTAGVITSQSKQLINSLPPAQLGSAPPEYQTAIAALNPTLRGRRTLVGFEKDPWCVPYLGVRAKAKPKIPFMPLSEVEITAEAYAKPFGGRIGPWYVKDWPQAVDGNGRGAYKTNAQNADQVEPIGGTRVTDITGITNLGDPSWAPNIARFPGDIVGFGSERVLAFFHQALAGPGVTAVPNSYNTLNVPAGAFPFPVSPDTQTSLRYYQNVAGQYTAGGPLDILSWDDTSQMAPKMRLMEIAAIAPTIYDLTYYSIDPNFYDNYFVPLENSILAGKRPGWDTTRFLLGDYGWRANNPQARRMSIVEQIKIQRATGVATALNSDFAMPYVVKQSTHLLNSWSVDNLLDYNINNTKFGECFSPATADFETPMNPPAPGNCVDGGRVGYSVKLVSKEWLKATDLELGGSGLTGALRNPPPW